MKIWNKKSAMALGILLISLTWIGGTVAYLTSEASDVNVFTLGKLDITLTETDTEKDNDNNVTTNTYEIKAAGQTITKDPKITLQPGCAACWLFVQLDKSENFDEFLEYTIEDDWIPLNGVDNVYYQEVPVSPEQEEHYMVIKDNQVIVKNDVTVQALNDLTEETYPKLIVSASAIQYGKGTGDLGSAESAWALLQAEQSTGLEG